MRFRTELKPEVSFPITHRDPVFLAGSCFTSHIGRKLAERQFEVMSNPYGTLFNPLSLVSNLTRSVSGDKFREADLLERDGLWYSWHHHSSIYGTSRQELLEKILAADARVRLFLERCGVLILTLGSAWVYERSGLSVANCHKIPASGFSKILLSSQEIEARLTDFMETFGAVNPGCRVIMTVSPVRHERDGLVENNRSKAALLTATHNLKDKFSHMSYFPAYELIIDDLRDYRFCEPDLVHPNDQAIEYVWEYFSEVHFKDETKALLKRINSVLAGEQHRPVNPESEVHQAFLSKLHREKEEIKRILGREFVG